MAVNKDKLLARLNIDTSPITTQLKAVESQFKSFGQELKKTVAIIDNNGIKSKVTTTFKELNTQVTEITREFAKFNKEIDDYETQSTTTTTNSLENQKKYLAMLKQWWKELSNNERNSIAYLQQYSQQLDRLAKSTTNSTTKGQILGVKNGIDSKLDSTIESSQKAIYGEITRLLQEQYSIKRQITEASDKELAILLQRKAIVDEDLIKNQTLLSAQSNILSNEAYEHQLKQIKLQLEQSQVSLLDRKNTALREQLQLNKQNLEAIKNQEGALKAQLLEKELNPEKKQVYANTIAGKFLNSAVYFGSGIIQSSIFNAFSTTLQSVALYEQGIVDLRRTMQDVTENELKDLGETAIRYAKEFGLSIKDVQTTMTELARVGINDSATLKGLTESVSVGLNTTEIKNASDMVGALISTIKQLNMDWGDSMNIIDTWNYLADQYAVHTDDFAKAIQKAGSASHNLGLELYDVNAIVTILGEATQASGNEIGTALKAMEVRLLKPETVATLESYGIAVKKNAEEYLSFQEILTNVNAKLEKFSSNSVAYQDIIQAMGGSFRANWVATLTDNWGQYDSLVAEQKKTQGYSVEENAKAMDTLTKKIEQAKASYTEMFITMSNDTGLTQFLKDAVDKLTAFANALKDSGIAKFLLKMVEMIALFKACLVPLKLLNKAIGVDLVKGIKDLTKSGLSKIFNTKDLNLYQKAIDKVNKSLDKQGVEYDERLVILKKIDKQLGTNAAGQLEYAHAEEETAKLNKPLINKRDLLDQQISKQLELNDIQGDTIQITKDLVDLDSETLDIKLKDLGLSEEQQIAIKENIVARQTQQVAIDQNTASLVATKVATGQATTTIEANTKAMITAKAAAFGLKVGMMALQAVMSWGIGAAISAIISGVTNLIHANDKLRESAAESAKAFNDEFEDLEETKEKLAEYNETLEDNNASIEDAGDARKGILEIQKDLMAAYGEENFAVNLLTASYKEQKQAILDKQKVEANDYLIKNRKAIRNAEDFLYDNDEIALPANYVKEIKDAYEEFGIKIDESRDNRYWAVEGTYQERVDKIRNIINRIRENATKSGTLDTSIISNTLDRLGKTLNELESDEEYVQNKEIGETAGRSRFLDSYTTLYGEILEAQKEFDEAYESGDAERITNAVDNIKSYKDQAIKVIGDDKLLQDYINNSLFEGQQSVIDDVTKTTDNLQNIFGESYNSTIQKYNIITQGYLNDLLTSCGATADNVDSILNNLGLDINDLGDDALIAMQKIMDAYPDNPNEGLGQISNVLATTKERWANLTEEQKASGITFEQFFYAGLKGAYNFDKFMQDNNETFDTLLDKTNEALDTYNDWIEKANALEDMDKNSRDYYNAVKEITDEYPDLIKGIDKTTGAYILQEDYIEQITKKQQEALDEQNKKTEQVLLGAINAAKTEEVLLEAQKKYDEFIKTKPILFDNSALKAIEAATKRIEKLIETAGNILTEYSNTISLLGNIDTKTEREMQAKVLESEYGAITQQITILEKELEGATEENRKSLEEEILALKERKVAIEDTTKALVEQLVSQEKSNKLSALEIEQTNELLELERQYYGAEGKEGYEKRIEKRLSAISKEINAETISELAEAYIQGDESRIKTLTEILDLQESITGESEKQVALEKLKLELENSKLQKTTQILQQDEQGKWQYKYVADIGKITELESQIAKAEQEYVAEQINAEKDELSDNYEKQLKVIEDYYEDMKTTIEVYYNDMSALVEEQFNKIADKISTSILTLTASLIGSEQLSTALNGQQLVSQLTGYKGNVSNLLLGEGSALSLNGLLEQLPELKVQTLKFDSILDGISELLSALTDKGNSTTEINIDKLEFPNITSPDGLERAILDLPIVATQYNGG